MIPATPVIVRPKSRWASKTYVFNILAGVALLLGSPELLKLAGDLGGARLTEGIAVAVMVVNLILREFTGQPLAGSPADPTKPADVKTPG